MNFLSVCSGIEAVSVAWESLGFQAVGFSEIEPFPSAVLAHRLPHVKNYGDMTQYGKWNIDSGSVDILVGGTPCQAFSVAGLRKGLADPRGNLALVFLGIADRFKPKYILWENVPGVLSSNGGRDFGSFLGALEKLGYGFAYRVLDAQFFGVPQRRRRVFVVGCLGDWDAPRRILFEPESLRGDSAPSRKRGEGATGGIEKRIDSMYETGQGFWQGGDVAGIIRAEGENRPSRPSNVIAEYYDNHGQDSHIVVMAHGQANAEIRDDGQATTLTCNHESPILAFPGRTAAAYGSTVRRLTPMECERLQGFPDNWTRIPWRGKPAENCPDAPRYTACGNSMAVPVMRWIGTRIKEVE